MMHQSGSIIVAIRAAALVAANEAILRIFRALTDASDTAILEAAIYDAVELLPDDMRPAGLPKRKVSKKPVAKADFGDLI